MTPKHGQLKVWHIPQMPMKPFEVAVKNLEEAALVLDVLADYDLFQFSNNIKPDYCNTSGLSIWDETCPDDIGDCWLDWNDELTGESFDEWRETQKQLN